MRRRDEALRGLGVALLVCTVAPFIAGAQDGPPLTRIAFGSCAHQAKPQPIWDAVLDYRPDQGSAFTDLAPSLLIPLADLPATGLLGAGSRATYSLLFAGRPGEIRAFRELLAERKAKGERLVGVDEESPQIQSSTRRAGRFLNLSAIITVLLAAVAVAMAARRYTQRHLDNVALMKCMGAPQRLVLQVTVIEPSFFITIFDCPVTRVISSPTSIVSVLPISYLATPLLLLAGLSSLRPTRQVASFSTSTLKSFSAWISSSSLPFLSSKRISLKLVAPPDLELRDLMPLCVALAGSL